MPQQTMSKRLSVTVPDAVAAKLEYWSDQEGRSVGNLCSYLIEQGIREAEKDGRLPVALPTTPKASEPPGEHGERKK